MKTFGRLPWPTPDELTEEQREFYDAIVNSPRGKGKGRATPLTDDEGRFYGPFNPLMTHPKLGGVVQQVSVALRFHGVLPAEVFEALVLMVAVERQASYEWYAHAPIGLLKGMTESQQSALRERRWEETAGLLSAPLVQLVRDSLAHRQPEEATVRAVEEEYGTAGVTEVVLAVANYDLVATLMRTWDVPLPEGVSDPLN
jgi:4-carboxymuconolactone decarboxylase